MTSQLEFEGEFSLSCQKVVLLEDSTAYLLSENLAELYGTGTVSKHIPRLVLHVAPLLPPNNIATVHLNVRFPGNRT